MAKAPNVFSKTAEQYADEFVDRLPLDMTRDRDSLNWRIGMVIGQQFVEVTSELRRVFETHGTAAGMTPEQIDEMFGPKT